jgi:hypothetical protein
MVETPIDVPNSTIRCALQARAEKLPKIARDSEVILCAAVQVLDPAFFGLDGFRYHLADGVFHAQAAFGELLLDGGVALFGVVEKLGQNVRDALRLQAISAGSFVTMFRKTVGVPPARYMFSMRGRAA